MTHKQRLQLEAVVKNALLPMQLRIAACEKLCKAFYGENDAVDAAYVRATTECLNS